MKGSLVLSACPAVRLETGRAEAGFQLASLPLCELPDPCPSQSPERLSQLLGDRKTAQRLRCEELRSLARRNDYRTGIGEPCRSIGHHRHISDPDTDAAHPGFSQRLQESPAECLFAPQALPPTGIDPSQLRADQHDARAPLQQRHHQALRPFPGRRHPYRDDSAHNGPFLSRANPPITGSRELGAGYAAGISTHFPFSTCT